MNRNPTIIEQFVIPHTAFAEAQRQIEQCFRFSTGQGAWGLAIVGESRTGKTSLLENFELKHQKSHDKDGMNVPVLCASVPSGPTIKSLAGKLLEGFGAPDPERGTENEKSRRLRRLIKESGTRMVMLDEFHHFYDRGKRRIMHNVADWLKVLIDDTRTTLVVAGLPSCKSVIDQNEQLAGRFLAPIEMPRFIWTDIGSRSQFIKILKGFHNEIAKQYKISEFYNSEMSFRFYCATGGLIGLLAKLLRQALRNASDSKADSILLHDLATAHIQSAWSSDDTNPFETSFQLVASVDLLDRVSKIGTKIEEEEEDLHPRRRAKGQRSQSVNSLLVA